MLLFWYLKRESNYFNNSYYSYSRLLLLLSSTGFAGSPGPSPANATKIAIAIFCIFCTDRARLTSLTSFTSSSYLLIEADRNYYLYQYNPDLLLIKSRPLVGVRNGPSLPDVKIIKKLSWMIVQTGKVSFCLVIWTNF